MTRDPARLASSRFDVLIVGGGIHGLFAAWDAAARGLSTALIDRDDFGGGISFNHQRTLHGGLRALQSGQVRKCREHIAERRMWAQIAPHLVRPLPFLIGTYRGTKRSRTAVRAGFALYDLIGRQRNRDVTPELRLPDGRLESVAVTRRLFPGIAEPGLSGGAIWYDYQTIHPDRLTWCVALAAESHGAVLCNYVEATGLLQDGPAVSGLAVRDTLTGDAFVVAARRVILAAGAGLPALHAAMGLGQAPPLIRAMNLLLDRPAGDLALAASAASGRMYTAVPWQGRVLVGTHQADAVAGPTGDPATAQVLEAFLADVNTAFPSLAATADDVRFIHHALVPATQRNGRADLLSDPQWITHPVAGVLSLVGVKYTTARLAAERAVDRLGLAPRADRPVAGPLPHAGIADVEGRLTEALQRIGRPLDDDVRRHLASWYGTEATVVAEAAAQVPSGLDRLSPETAVLCGDITWAARHACAPRLTDLVFRRTPLASAGHPGDTAIERAADLAAAEFGWSVSRRADELARVRARLDVRAI